MLRSRSDSTACISKMPSSTPRLIHFRRWLGVYSCSGASGSATCSGATFCTGMIVVSSSAVRAGEPSLLVLRPLTEAPFLTGAAWSSGASCRGFCMGSMTVSAPDTTSGALYVAA